MPTERFFHRLTEKPSAARILLEVSRRVEQENNQRNVLGKIVEVLPLRPLRKCPRERYGELTFTPTQGFRKPGK